MQDLRQAGGDDRDDAEQRGERQYPGIAVPVSLGPQLTRPARGRCGRILRKDPASVGRSHLPLRGELGPHQRADTHRRGQPLCLWAIVGGAFGDLVARHRQIYRTPHSAVVTGKRRACYAAAVDELPDFPSRLRTLPGSLQAGPCTLGVAGTDRVRVDGLGPSPDPTPQTTSRRQREDGRDADAGADVSDLEVFARSQASSMRGITLAVLAVIAMIASTICVRGWTRAIRPPQQYRRR
jgi:hypothetical protein